MKLSSIVPWGRSFDEYRDMFALMRADLQGRILGCADGPASFNAEATRLGARVVSADPLYAHSAGAIEARVADTFTTVMAQNRAEADRYVWTRWTDPNALGEARLAAMRLFLDDYEAGKAAGRYVPASLPDLPFADGAFDLAVCSYLLFAYSEHMSCDAHIAGARELLRVAREVRIFPLITLMGERSPYLDPVIEALRGDGHLVEERRVNYEFRRGGNAILRVRCRT